MKSSNKLSTRSIVAPTKKGGMLCSGRSTATHKYPTRSKGTFQYITDISDRLAKFTLELPDPNEQLIVQQWSSNKFSFFSKLPLELRIMIWKASLPRGRLVNLNNEMTQLFCTSHKRGACGTPFPVSLHVNQESRRETLRCYQIFRLEDFPFDIETHFWCRRRPICFSPSRDYFWFREAALGSTLKKFIKRYPVTIRAIKTLVVELGTRDSMLSYHEAVAKFQGLQKLLILQPSDPHSEVWVENWKTLTEELLPVMQSAGFSVPETLKLLPHQSICRNIWWDN
ncbi:hypothetical protein ONS95_012889 [Cadophora gregata]|uniref:uncharacterized protein n=1 Tax=Cadophora gregata TaxID=51156 RepID=UPI0026DBC89B|nr:uncharacterized protein ONS95_012889 [Cadophora gregata]KAK0101130.1 hypothetical protein ONS96_006355 [Cadophora gregata f. sp. sojae]KAK0115838.1 hypothetical protein ONS95_012889 [Cadophora gregata]